MVEVVGTNGGFMDCLFCKIVNGEISSNLIYEDDKIMAFYDINPVAKKHALVIPKIHRESLNDISSSDNDVISHIMVKIKDIAETMGIKKSGYRVISNCGEDGGQEIPHIHFHIIGGEKLSARIV